MRELLLPWLRKPDSLLMCFLMVIPILASQILQRLYPIIDNRYLTVLGSQALYIHNVQYNFTTFGQFIGFATFISCLVFWKRKECRDKQGSILIKHLVLAGSFTLVVAILSWIFAPTILTYYKIDPSYLAIATIYLKIGLCSMVLQAIYGGLDGMLVGSQQQRGSMYIALFLVITNVVVDRYAVYSLYSGMNNAGSISSPIIMIALSNVILLLIGILLALSLVVRRVHGWNPYPLKEMLPVWWGETGSYLVRGVAPFFYTYQLTLINAAPGFLVTYQLAFHLSYIFCFPLIAAMQVAVRDAGQLSSDETPVSGVPRWWNAFLYTGLMPTTALLVMGIFASVPLMRLIYDYNTPIDHIPFLTLFFIGCWMGQWGNTFTIPLRAAKKSYLITKNFFFAELIAMLGGTQLLIYFGIATPTTVGYVTLLFTLVYGLSNLLDARSLNAKKKLSLAYEKNI